MLLARQDGETSILVSLKERFQSRETKCSKVRVYWLQQKHIQDSEIRKGLG